MGPELPPSERPPEDFYQSEKEREKEREKEQEKEQEKEREKEREKGQQPGEKFRRDPVGAAFGAGVLILVGLILMADNLGFLPQIGKSEVWHWIACGIGIIILLEVLVRATSPDHARPVTGRLIFGGILLAAGLSGIIETTLIWPLILILIGFAVLARNLFRQS
jgi:hypothetical protein